MSKSIEAGCPIDSGRLTPPNNPIDTSFKNGKKNSRSFAFWTVRVLQLFSYLPNSQQCNQAALRIIGNCPNCRSDFCGTVHVHALFTAHTSTLTGFFLQHRLPEHHACNNQEALPHPLSLPVPTHLLCSPAPPRHSLLQSQSLLNPIRTPLSLAPLPLSRPTQLGHHSSTDPPSIPKRSESGTFGLTYTLVEPKRAPDLPPIEEKPTTHAARPLTQPKRACHLGPYSTKPRFPEDGRPQAHSWSHHRRRVCQGVEAR